MYEVSAGSDEGKGFIYEVCCCEMGFKVTIAANCNDICLQNTSKSLSCHLKI